MALDIFNVIRCHYAKRKCLFFFGSALEQNNSPTEFTKMLEKNICWKLVSTFRDETDDKNACIKHSHSKTHTQIPKQQSTFKHSFVHQIVATLVNIIHRSHSREITHLITYIFRLNFINDDLILSCNPEISPC